MSIMVSNLKCVVKKPNGAIVAQCPVCAATGGDTKGDHLIIYQDGAYGCVIHPKDPIHNAHILKLAGDDGKAWVRPKPTIRPHKVPPSEMIHEIPRRTLIELGLRPNPQRVFMHR